MLHHHLIRVMYVFAQKKEALWEETLRWASQSIRNATELLPTRSTAVTIVCLAAFWFKLEQIKAGKEDHDVVVKSTFDPFWSKNVIALSFYPSKWPWGATEISPSWKRDRKQSNTTILVTVLVSVCYKYMKLTYWRADGVQVGSLPPLPTQTFSYHPFNDIWIKTLITRIALNLKISI